MAEWVVNFPREGDKLDKFLAKSQHSTLREFFSFVKRCSGVFDDMTLSLFTK